MKGSGKNNTLKKCLFAALGIAGGYFLAGIGVVIASCVKNSKKMEKYTDECNSMMAYMFQKDEVSIKPETQNVYLTFFSSFVNVVVPKPEKECMNIEITSILGKVNIDLPSGVKINCEGSDRLKYTEEGAEDGPVINLIVRDHLSSLTLSFEEE